MLFFSIFLPLFSIASVVFLIKMAHITSVIQLTFFELIKLYLFTVPELLFYTLPITFFIAGVLSLHRLSTDNEMIVFFSLGINPGFLARIFMRLGLLLSMLLAFDFFIMFPHTKNIAKNFINFKKSEAQFNLSASEYGNKFGDWLLYIGKDNQDGTYSDIVLFKKETSTDKEDQEEIFITAKEASIINQNGILKLLLHQGEGDTYTPDTLSQITFETMRINNALKDSEITYLDPFDYWLDPEEGRTYKLYRNILLSLFPLLSAFIILSIGIVHTRQHAGFIYLYIFFTLVVYYGLSIGLGKMLTVNMVAGIIAAWLFLTFLIYRQKVLARF